MRAPAHERYRPLPLPTALRALVGGATRLVPSPRRAVWRREWEAELTYAYSRAAATGAGSGRILVRALWSYVDALWVRKEEISMARLVADVRLAIRGLRRTPVFTLVTIATLALGIGANAAVFSLVNGVLLQPLPFDDPDRLVLPIFEAPGLGYPEIPYSDGLFVFVRDHQRAFDSLGIWSEEQVNVVGEGGPERVRGAVISASIFDVLRVAPVQGRAFTPADMEPGAEPIVLLSHEIWSRRYGADPSLLGQQLELDGVMRRVVGVMPPDLAFPDPETQLWRPFTIDPAAFSAGSFSYPGVARLAPGATLQTAHEDLEALLPRFAETFPNDLPLTILEQARFAPTVRPFKEVMVGDVRQALYVVLGTVGLVLLIACANVANLFLVRADGRQREVTLRRALGARAGDLLRFHLGESMVLTLMGGALGLGLATAAVRAFAASAPVAIPRIESVRTDVGVLAFAAAVSLATGLVFALVPLLRRRNDLASELRESGRSATGSSRALHARNVLVVAQVALALVLLIGSGLMMRSFRALRNVDPGFVQGGALTVRVALPRAEYPEPDQRDVFWRAAIERVAALPGIEVVGGTTHLPLAGNKSSGSIRIDGHTPGPGELPNVAAKRQVTPNALVALGVPLLSGRMFDAGDSAEGFRAALVSESFAQHWWPEEGALGKRVSETESEDWYEIVGVVGDVRHDSIEAPVEETVYFALRKGSAEALEVPAALDLVVRTTIEPDAMMTQVREAIWEIDRRLPIANMRPLEDVVADSLARTSFTLVMLGLASATALLLGTIGIYGVISYVVAQRTQEIGLRLALGASAPTVRRLVVRRGLALTGVGVVLGLGGALAASRTLGNLLFEVDATDPLTYAGVTALVSAVALVASWIPALRASWVDPAVALRTE